MISKKNPNITTYYEDIEIGEKHNMNEYNFRIAFTIEDWYFPKFKDSEEYVKWAFRIYGNKDNVAYERVIPYRRCTDKDYEEFYPIEKPKKQTLADIRSDPDRDFYCIDWDDENPFVIYGTETQANNQRLEMILLPCNMVKSDIGPWNQTVSEICNTNLAEQINYIGTS